jgi:hypothetical protein
LCSGPKNPLGIFLSVWYNGRQPKNIEIMQWQSSYTSLKPEIVPASAGTFYPVYHHFPTSTDCRYPVVDVTHAPSPLEETHLQVIPVSQANWPPSAIALDRSKALTPAASMPSANLPRGHAEIIIRYLTRAHPSSTSRSVASILANKFYLSALVCDQFLYQKPRRLSKEWQPFGRILLVST